MALPTSYNTGTASVTGGGVTVTGQGTNWLTAGVQAGDLFVAGGLQAEIATVNSNTSITLADAWPGTSRVTDSYRVRFTPDATRGLTAMNAVLSSISNGILYAFSALTSAANKLAYFTGAGTMAVTDFTAHARAVLALSGGAGKFVRSTGTNTAVMQDIVGPVSQLSGTPTGALIEAGSNANGNYAKFADGTMICSGKVAISFANTTALIGAWTFPAVFSGAPSGVAGTALWGEASGALTSNGYQTYGDVAATTLTSSAANLRIGRQAGANFASGDAVNASVIAVGRWF